MILSGTPKGNSWSWSRSYRWNWSWSRSWRRILLDLSRVAKECANAGWDGYNAKPISNDAVLTTALAIGFNLIPRTVEPPLIIPEPTGNIGLEWENKDGSIFVLSFSKTNQITYAGIFSDGRKIHGTEPFSTEIPQTILQVLLADFAKQSN